MMPGFSNTFIHTGKNDSGTFANGLNFKLSEIAPYQINLPQGDFVQEIIKEKKYLS